MAKFTQLLAVFALGASAIFPVCASDSAHDVPIIAHDGEPVGKAIDHNNLTLYITGKPSDTAVLYLTDVFGIQLPENKLLADSFGRAGYLTVAPDLFNGTPAPGDLVDPAFNLTDFLDEHRPEVLDPILTSVVDFIHEELGVDNIVAAGYCFGGRHSLRLLSEGRGVSAGFAAHPSLLEDDEITAITSPASLAAAEVDDALPAERRHAIEEQLLASGQPYSLSLYSGTEHGFGVRANVSDPQQKFGKEQAFYQAVQWFDAWAT